MNDKNTQIAETVERKPQVTERRKTLIVNSRLIRKLVEDGVFETVNEGLIAMYSDNLPKGTEWRSFKGWRKAGKNVIKGESAYCVWGRPRKVPSKEDDSEFKYYPVAYIFHSGQVEGKGGSNGSD